MAIADGVGLNCATASYVNLQTSGDWTLPAVEGTPAISVCLKDDSGLTARVEDSINLDLGDPVPVFTVNGGSPYANSTTNIPITLTFTGDVVGWTIIGPGDDCLALDLGDFNAVGVGTTTVGNMEGPARDRHRHGHDRPHPARERHDDRQRRDAYTRHARDAHPRSGG
jgi:hypothetical protein